MAIHGEFQNFEIVMFRSYVELPEHIPGDNPRNLNVT